MQKLSWIFLALTIISHPAALAATRDEELPDREMLRLMDSLRDWEMIKNMEMMRELRTMEQAGELASGVSPQKSLPKSKKEGAK